MLHNFWLCCYIWLQFGIADAARNGKDTLNSPSTPMNHPATQVTYALSLVITVRLVILAQSQRRAVSLDNDGTGVA